MIVTKEDYNRAHEAIAVLAKVYNIEGDNIGLLSLLKYSLGELSFKETKNEIKENFPTDIGILEGLHNIENSIKSKKEWDNQLSSELCLNIGIRLMEEYAYEESRKWLLRTIHKTISVIDLNSSKEIPNLYLEKIESWRTHI